MSDDADFMLMLRAAGWCAAALGLVLMAMVWAAQ